METTPALQVDQPARYRIQFLGRAEADWGDWLSDLDVQVAPAAGPRPALTTLTGRVADQAALFGLLACLRDLGLPLLRVEALTGPSAHTETSHELVAPLP